MVFIDRGAYNTFVSTNKKLLAFSNLCTGDLISMPDIGSMPEADQVYYQAIQAIQTNNNFEFNNAYQVLSKRTPTKDSPTPFVHNDFLIFTLICGIIKFNIDKAWIKNIIDVRSRNAITNTFENIINGNTFNNTNLPEVTISLMNILEKSEYPSKYLNDSYKKIIAYRENYYISDFLKLSALNAYDTIILLKDVAENGEYTLLKKFETRFLKRINIAGIILYNITTIAILYGLIKVIALYPYLKNFVEQTGLIVGVLGIGIISSNLLRKVRKWFISILLLLLGYPKEKLIK